MFMPRTCIRALSVAPFATLALGLAACGSMTVSAPPPPAPATTGSGDATSAGGIPASIGAFTDTSPVGMLTKLQGDYQAKSGYKTWSNDGLHYVADLKVYATSYLSATLQEAVTAGAASMPVGSVSVLELYTDSTGKTLAGWAVLAKANANGGASSWLSYEVKQTNGVFGNPSVYALGDPSCATCHTPEPGYMVPLPK